MRHNPPLNTGCFLTFVVLLILTVSLAIIGAMAAVEWAWSAVS